MQYAQIINSAMSQQFGEAQLVEWDDRNYCTAPALIADGKANQFGVVPLLETPPPSYNPITQVCQRDGSELVGGQWQYKWTVVELDAATVAANQAAAALTARESANAQRAAAVAAIKVTTASGNTFDGDEISQTRMSRAVQVLKETGTPSCVWVLADNSVIQATPAELVEALALAGAAQAAIWVIN